MFLKDSGNNSMLSVRNPILEYPVSCENPWSGHKKYLEAHMYTGEKCVKMKMLRCEVK